MQAPEVHTTYLLHVTPEKFYIEPRDSPVVPQLLVINRMSHEITLEAPQGQIPPVASSKEIFGVIGILPLIAGPYLIVVTQRKKVGEINGQAIWSVKSSDVISFARSMTHLTEKQATCNATYLSMIQILLETPSFYFSYSYDITHSLQRLHNTAPDFLRAGLLERADARFVWNGYLLAPMSSRNELKKFCLPIMMGFLSINQCTLNGKSFMWSVVARRSCHRAGTRLYTRGIDAQGNVANYVEVEQIVEYKGDRGSFIQTRGSIPLFWSQRPNLRYKPRPQLNKAENHSEAFLKHFHSQIFHYGKQVLVNLVDHKGAEGELEQSYGSLVAAMAIPDVRYEAFDFHRECRHMQWDRLNILVDRLTPELEEYSYFLLTRDGVVRSQQEGVFRTNCVDCLDRTNVVQCLLARKSLETILQRLGVLQEGEKIMDHPAFEFLFKNVWADNGDQCSLQYAGTGALKADYTRTGKRTKLGVLQDGKNALIRYLKNNFQDGFRQDAMDLFLGNYIVNESEGLTRPCPLQKEKALKFFFLPLVTFFAICMWLMTVLIPQEYSASTLLFLLFWATMIVGSMLFVVRNGTEFVDNPKLTELGAKKHPSN